MDRLVSLNSQLLAVAEARIDAVGSAAFYGCGIFTTAAVVDGELFQWEKHWRRLYGNARQISIDLSGLRETEVKASLEMLIRQNRCINGRARITIFDETSGGPWHDGREQRMTVLIVTSGNLPQRVSPQLAVSPYICNSTSPLAGVKSCNYLEPLLALDEAKSRGFDEAIRLNERGEVTSACMANIFWLQADRLFTPSLKTGCLAGTTREYILENIDCEEVRDSVDALRVADAVFLTSAGLGVVQAFGFDGKVLPQIEHPILRILPF